MFSLPKETVLQIKDVEVRLVDDNYVLLAGIDYQLGFKVHEALQSGVPLFWNISIKVWQHHRFFWDQTIIDKTVRYRIQYHALLNMYRIRNEQDGKMENFSTLVSALDAMSLSYGLNLIDQSELQKEERYFVGLKVFLDRDALPLPLRPMAYINPQWYSTSDWKIWPLMK